MSEDVDKHGDRWPDDARLLRTGSLDAPPSSGMTGQQRTAQRIISRIWPRKSPPGREGVL
jgi:hypothetical protein